MHLETGPRLPAREVDEVPPGATDRRLHDVQDTHEREDSVARSGTAPSCQYAPVPLSTANPVNATITRSSRNDWCSM
jgi:hypothetical protein